MWSLLILLPVLAPQEHPAARAAHHWAYTAPVRPTPPRSDVSPIDAFVDANAIRAGLTLAAEADRATLLRRLTFDLIGLPPTLEELDAFLADRSPDAYERAVDRLLASPHYGERWASPWLDLARYADTDGFNFDSPRTMWKYRDWVVDALNRDLPFDRFSELQLAGDLMPDAGEEGRIATGFHRNTMLNDEGGVDAEEARWDRLLDRASTTATVWLGSTLHCAQCHDHKYDPISQRDFYAMVAFFEPASEDKLELPTPEQTKRRRELQERVAQLEATGAAAAAITAAKKELKAFAVDSTLVLSERAGVAASTTLRVRGSYDVRGDTVEAAVPQALGPAWPADAPKNRLGLARWLVQPDHPLTARVHVNRLWGHLFGRPLVATPEDFGMQVPPVDHKELLDWLATEFVRLGWSQKRLLRTIVLSATYRRQCAVPADERERDPQNRWLARGARFRLPAEHVRDLQLAASGLLAPAIGGPGVFPLQADVSGVVPTNKAQLRWQPSAGHARHRRGLYTFWRRTATFVQFAVFDAPSREQCIVLRQRTNTPLQALSALNDPAAWEAAKALGARMAKAAGDDRDRLALGFRLCTSRAAEAEELDLLENALRAEAADQRWTLAGNALLNLDEALSR
ncbi:MAG TPA: DUF1549 and DUF1553 domain-containing protein [Planctomycetota bacterium]